jgi:Cys-tRNA(Pro) deacylase
VDDTAGATDDARVERVRSAMLAAGLSPSILVAEGSTHTAEMAAQAADCELGQIIKTLVVYVGGTPHLALVAGDRRLDDRLLAQRFGVGRKQVKLANAEQVLSLTGYPVGGVSPFGLPAPLPSLADESLQRFETVWIAAGTASAICPIERATLVRLLNADVAAIAS